MDELLEMVNSKNLYNVRDLETILDQLPFIIWLKDDERKYRFVNQCFINKTSIRTNWLDRNMILQQEDNTIWGNEIASIIENGENEVLKTKETVCYEKCIKVDGKDKWYQFNFIPIKEEGEKLQYILGMREEITLHKKMEIQLDKNYYKTYISNKLYAHDLQIDSREAEYIHQMQSMSVRLQEVLEEIEIAGMTEGIMVGIYNKDRNTLCCTYKKGMTSYEIALLDEVKLINNVKEKMINLDNLWEVRRVQNYYDYIHITHKHVFHNDDLKYLGCYPLVLDDEVLGVLICDYSRLRSIDSNKEKQIFKIAKQLALIIQNEILTRAVKRELEKREALEEELQNFAETASDLMVIVKEDGFISKVSGAWEAILGWTNKELEGKHFEEFIYGEDKKHEEKVDDYINNTAIVRGIIYRNKCKEKGYKWIEWSTRYISSRKHYICTGRDISKEKEQEKARKAYEEALEVEKIKGEFFANMSHEFRTPLNIILATVQLLEKEIRQEHLEKKVDLEKYLSAVKQNTYRILRLANNIIELTSIDTGYCRVNLENLNIISIIEETTLSVAEYIESRGITLIFDTEVEEVITICDAEKLERIILNILSNSVKYTPKGGVIAVNVSLENKNIIIKVKDTGVGIPKEKLNTIFNPFVHVDPILTRKCEGIGVGLALVKSLVELHGGIIEARSELGKGTEMIIKLPVRYTKKKEIIYPVEFAPRIEQTKMEFSDIYNL